MEHGNTLIFPQIFSLPEHIHAYTAKQIGLFLPRDIFHCGKEGETPPLIHSPRMCFFPSGWQHPQILFLEAPSAAVGNVLVQFLIFLGQEAVFSMPLVYLHYF